jgi:hypothetical protein
VELQDDESVAHISKDELACPIEAILNVLYLIKCDSNNPAAVRRYVELAELPMERLIQAVFGEV